jgi:protein phosphatase
MIDRGSSELASASVTDRGLSDKRPQNEDSFLELSEEGIFAVADGVGGAQAGDVASQMAMEILAEAFRNRGPDSDAESVMRAAIESANGAIFRLSRELPQLESMATTIVALHVAEGIATIGHVGDSRLYRVDQHGNLARETQDHSVVEEEVRAGRMTPDQAANHPSRNIISRALGAESSVVIDLKTTIAEPSTTYMLCSDGITRHIDDWEIASLLSAGLEPREVCDRLKEICYERGAEDNLTAVIVRTSETAHELPAGAETVKIIDPMDEEPVADAPAAVEAGGVESNEAVTEEMQLADLGDVDDEADTIATARPAGVEERPEPEHLDEEVAALAEPPAESVEVIEQPPAPSAAPPLAEPKPSERYIGPTFGSDLREMPAERSKAASIGTAVLFLLLGAAAGVAGYYFWLRSQPVETVAPPVITEMKSGNVALTAFEEARRAVDRDPLAYIEKNALISREASDFFLLGRAYLLNGNTAEAKSNFIKARDGLAQADPADAKTMAVEIAMALAVLDSPAAAEAFRNSIRTAAEPPANTNSAAQPSGLAVPDGIPSR